jgi:hypothetical protein
MRIPDLLVVAIDANCSSFAKARGAIEQNIDDSLRALTVIACPDPHVERWYLADPDSFAERVGVRPELGKRKCVRDLYKRKLSEAILGSGQPAPLGGIEFAAEIVAGMNLHRAGRSEDSLRHFVQDATALLRRVKVARN